MAISDDSEQTPAAPAPTHWNTRRDPEASFHCPHCKNKIELSFIYNPRPEDPPIFAVCWSCKVAFARDAWEKEKLEEMLNDCDF